MDVWPYLTDVLRRIPAIAPDDTAALEALLPDRWLAGHPEHRREQREEESRAWPRPRRRRKRAARRISEGYVGSVCCTRNRGFVLAARGCDGNVDSLTLTHYAYDWWALQLDIHEEASYFVPWQRTRSISSSNHLQITGSRPLPSHSSQYSAWPRTKLATDVRGSPCRAPRWPLTQIRQRLITDVQLAGVVLHQGIAIEARIVVAAVELAVLHGEAVGITARAVGDGLLHNSVVVAHDRGNMKAQLLERKRLGEHVDVPLVGRGQFLAVAQRFPPAATRSPLYAAAACWLSLLYRRACSVAIR